MRVISGAYKGRRLASPPGSSTRPTTDRVKENLFNIITPYLNNAYVADLFSGSGALGIEAISRGAQHVYFVEKSKEALHIIEKNLSQLSIEKNKWTLFCGDVETFLQNSGVVNLPARSLTLVLADPPYALGWYDKAIGQLNNSGLCAHGCIAVLEMEKGLKTSNYEMSWELFDERIYGKVRLEFWKNID